MPSALICLPLIHCHHAWKACHPTEKICICSAQNTDIWLNSHSSVGGIPLPVFLGFNSIEYSTCCWILDAKRKIMPLHQSTYHCEMLDICNLSKEGKATYMNVNSLTLSRIRIGSQWSLFFNLRKICISQIHTLNYLYLVGVLVFGKRRCNVNVAFVKIMPNLVFIFARSILHLP